MQKKTIHWHKGKIMAVATLVFALAISAGFTLAYLVDWEPEVENNFGYAWVSCAVSEKTSGNTKSEVTVENTGNTAAYIRAYWIITWKDANGNVYGASQPVQDTNYTLTLNDNGWSKIGDYYYCNQAVAPNANTADLIESCVYVTGAPAGYTLSVQIIADAVQSNPTSAVTEAWSAVTVDEDGKLVAIYDEEEAMVGA